jgi:hypothetical protein
VPHPTFMIPADPSNWVQRVEAGVRVAEALLGVPFAKAHAGTKHNATEKDVPDLARYLKGRLKTKTRPFSLFHGRGWRKIDGTFRNLDYYTVGGSMYADLPLFSLAITYPDAPASKHEEMLVKAGDAFGAHTGTYTPLDTWSRWRLAHSCFALGTQLLIHDMPDRTPAEEQLPLIRDCTYGGFEHVLQPQAFGWINYWSAEVCEYVGFPERLAGSPVRDLCYRTPRGAWIVKLSEQPLEPANEAHTNLLREMYERFPRVGVRCSREDVSVWKRPDVSFSSVS